jgi:hypothetical protein
VLHCNGAAANDAALTDIFEAEQHAKSATFGRQTTLFSEADTN